MTNHRFYAMAVTPHPGNYAMRRVPTD